MPHHHTSRTSLCTVIAAQHCDSNSSVMYACIFSMAESWTAAGLNALVSVNQVKQVCENLWVRRKYIPYYSFTLCENITCDV